MGTAITGAETVEDVRQTLAEYPDATDHLREVVETDRDEHVTSYEEALENMHRYNAARTEANSPPTLRETVREVLPARLDGTTTDEQKSKDPTDQIDGPLRPADRHPAVVGGMTASDYRALGMDPEDYQLAAEETANTAVETAANAGELCWGLRQTPGAHKDFLVAIRNENAHTNEKGTAFDQAAKTRAANAETRRDDNLGKGL